MISITLKETWKGVLFHRQKADVIYVERGRQMDRNVKKERKRLLQWLQVALHVHHLQTQKESESVELCCLCVELCCLCACVCLCVVLWWCFNFMFCILMNNKDLFDLRCVCCVVLCCVVCGLAGCIACKRAWIPCRNSMNLSRSTICVLSCSTTFSFTLAGFTIWLHKQTSTQIRMNKRQSLNQAPSNSQTTYSYLINPHFFSQRTLSTTKLSIILKRALLFKCKLKGMTLGKFGKAEIKGYHLPKVHDSNICM